MILGETCIYYPHFLDAHPVFLVNVGVCMFRKKEKMKKNTTSEISISFGVKSQSRFVSVLCFFRVVLVFSCDAPFVCQALIRCVTMRAVVFSCGFSPVRVLLSGRKYANVRVTLPAHKAAKHKEEQTAKTAVEGTKQVRRGIYSVPGTSGNFSWARHVSSMTSHLSKTFRPDRY